MFFEQLNSVIDYIENHLKENIDLDNLASMLNTNQDTFKRIFALICGVSVAEYIKKRRLTVCCSDLKNYSVLEVAFAYGYTSNAGFSRAFYNFHHCYPSAVKQNKDVKLNAFLPIKISTNLGLTEINYNVVDLNKQEFFGYYIESEVSALPRVVGQEYKRFVSKFKTESYCGITIYEKDNRAKFWLCSNEICENLQKITLPAGTWLVLEYTGAYEDISKFVKTIYRDIGHQINCRLAHKIDMEIYTRSGVKLCFLLK